MKIQKNQAKASAKTLDKKYTFEQPQDKTSEDMLLFQLTWATT